MRVLITGGSGFLGTRLLRDLLQRGQFVGQTPDEIVIADLAPPAGTLVRSPRVRHLVGPLIDQCPAFVREILPV